MRKTKDTLFTAFATCLILFSLGLTAPSTLQEQLSKMIQENCRLTILVSEQKQMILERDVLITGYRTQLKDDAIALEPARFACERGNTLAFWAKNPDHLKSVWKWTKQYKYLLTPEAVATAKDFNIEHFAFLWHFKESKYDPYKESKNKDGSTDWGMSQINDVNWDRLHAKLPEHLKTRLKPKQDPEVAVAMLYLWINSRVEMKWAWAYLSPEAWTLMWRLNQIDG